MTDEAAPDARDADPPTVPRRRSGRGHLGPFSGRHIAAVVAITVGSAIVLVVGTQPIRGSTRQPAVDPGATFYQISAATQGLDIGQVAPELAGDDQGSPLRDLDDQPITLAALRGHPVWINFWATWCPPCQRETPVLRDTYEAHKSSGLVLLAIDVQEEPEAVRDYAARYGLTYRIGLDVTGAVFRTYRIYGLPSQYFLDRNGVIRSRYFGPLTSDLAEEQLRTILAP